MIISKHPKVKPVFTTADNRIVWLGRALLVAMWGLTIYYYIQSPDVVPMHFNAGGAADGYGNKITFFIIPVVASFIYALLAVLNNYPEMLNYPVAITEANAAKQYTIATRFIRILNVLILLLFISVGYIVYRSSQGAMPGGGTWIVLLSIVFIVPIVIYMIMARRAG